MWYDLRFPSKWMRILFLSVINLASGENIFFLLFVQFCHNRTEAIYLDILGPLQWTLPYRFTKKTSAWVVSILHTQSGPKRWFHWDNEGIQICSNSLEKNLRNLHGSIAHCIEFVEFATVHNQTDYNNNNSKSTVRQHVVGICQFSHIQKRRANTLSSGKNRTSRGNWQNFDV